VFHCRVVLKLAITFEGLRSLLLGGSAQFQSNKNFCAPQKQIAKSPLLQAAA